MTFRIRSFRRLGRYYLLYAAGFVGLVLFLAVAERFGLAPRWIGRSSCSRPSRSTPSSV
jgi:hypothetical protein